MTRASFRLCAVTASLAAVATLEAGLASAALPASPVAPASATGAVPAPADTGHASLRRARSRYAAMVERVAALAEDARAQELVERRRMQILNVMWEDTGRFEGSAVGPNISDVTIEVELDDGRGQKRTALMPVMRAPNFTDKTGDVDMDKIRIPVGNHVVSGQALQGGAVAGGQGGSGQGRAGQGVPGGLQHVTLRQFLAEPGRYLSLPDKGRIKGGSLLAPRDGHVLVSAQATFLPVPEQGTATFWPVIFNYQSTKRHPAVLTLLVTRQGTSATIVDNARDTLGGSWGQRLFFNAAGQKAPLTAERLSAVKQSGVTSNGESADSLGGDANLLMLIQVPLALPPARRRAPKASMSFDDDGLAAGAPAAAPMEEKASRAHRSDMEVAVLGHGRQMGPYTELDGLAIERDPRFPVRVTVQFYQATSNGVLSAADVRALAAQIREVYASADTVGSLVVPAATDRTRPTRWEGAGPAPAALGWSMFPGLVERFGAAPSGVPPMLARP